jgi:hypothetical protein
MAQLGEGRHRRWQRTATTDHFRSAFGGMGSINDLYLADSSDPNSIWLDAAMRAARSVAASVAAAAAADRSAFRQVPPSSSMLGASCYHCRTCTDTFVTDAAHLWPAAEGWASWRVASMLQDGTGAHVAAEALGERDPDLRPAYLVVAVLGNDDVAALACVLPDLPIRRRVQADLGNMDALGILIGKLANEYARQVLIKEQLHAGVARRCSRIAANARAARTWSVVNSGKSATISSVVIPDAKYSNTS